MSAQDIEYEKSDLYKLRHTAAHIMAQAVLELYPAAKLAIGPPIADGFYYDFDLGHDEEGRPVTFSPEDLEAIEARMRRIIAGRFPLQYRRVAPDEAEALFADQPYKLELVRDLVAAARGEPAANGSGPELSTYRHDSFEDLCRGPHVADTGAVPPDGFKLMSIAGAYWRGDEKQPMLQRIYGTAWPSRAELEAHLAWLEEAKKRDHRRLGKELELFHLDETAPGMPYWLPKGFKLLQALMDFWREEHEANGYQEIATPLINDVALWHKSGHWDHYREEMYLIPIDEDRLYGVKPMNCPNAMIVFGLKPRSYRDLPLRLADTDILHRHEKAGTLHGLLRVNHIQQDDAHIFVREDQIEAEFDRILSMAVRFYAIFGLSFRMRLGTRPEKFMGDPALWDEAEAALERILERHAPGSYFILEGDGAFYGPKIDILMEDAMGREWQMGTLQLDLQLPRRFDLKYRDQDGVEKVPVVIHRVIYGSLERFIGILIEHFAGAMPPWLAPVQVMVVPIADRHIAYADAVAAQLRAARLRVEVDDSGARMNAKLRAAQLQKVPYMLIVGDKEAESGSVSLRDRDGKRVDGMPLAEFAAYAADKVAARAVGL